METKPTLEELAKTEISEDFIQKMRNRMLTSYYKYGGVKKNKGIVDEIGSLVLRLEKYKETGNTEWLIDAANFAMIEFMQPDHPKAHFRATSSEESPGLKYWKK